MFLNSMPDEEGLPLVRRLIGAPLPRREQAFRSQDAEAGFSSISCALSLEADGVE